MTQIMEYNKIITKNSQNSESKKLFVFVCMWVGGFRNCNYLNTEETSKNEIYCIIVTENNESLWVQYKDSPQG